MKKYKHLFFDLDHTLWDFKTNSRLTLSEIFENFDFNMLGSSDHTEFVKVYEKNNHQMWSEYRSGKMSKETLRTERFRKSMAQIGIKDRDLVEAVADYYVDHSPYKTALFPDAISVLTTLQEHYNLHIITNGFEEIQAIKMKESGLNQFFTTIITSEGAGTKKPHPAIFQYSLKQVGGSASESLMIGDNQLVDINGAAKVGIDGVFFNPEKEETIINPTYEITFLKQLLGFL